MAVVAALITGKLAAEVIDVISDVNNAVDICQRDQNSGKVKTMSVVIAIVSLVSFAYAFLRRRKLGRARKNWEQLQALVEKRLSGINQSFEKEFSAPLQWCAESWEESLRLENKKRESAVEMKWQEGANLCVTDKALEAIDICEAGIDMRCSIFEDLPSAIFNLSLLMQGLVQDERLNGTQLITFIVSAVGVLKMCVSARQIVDAIDTNNIARLKAIVTRLALSDAMGERAIERDTFRRFISQIEKHEATALTKDDAKSKEEAASIRSFCKRHDSDSTVFEQTWFRGMRKAASLLFIRKAQMYTYSSPEKTVDVESEWDQMVYWGIFGDPDQTLKVEELDCLLDHPFLDHPLLC